MNYDDAPFELYESQPLNQDNWTSVTMAAIHGTDLTAKLEELGNGFWDCLISGTTFQVWSYLDPAHLQWTILREFPVQRSEAQLREFVEEWGPQAYTSFPYGSVPNYANVPPEQASHVANKNLGSIRISTPRGPVDQETRIGVITMVPASGENDLGYYEIHVTEFPDGSWLISGLGGNPNVPRG